MLSGLKDVDREILKYVDDKELLKICSIDRKTWNEICDDNFLKRRLARYPDIEKFKKEDESYKQFFLRVIYYTSKMREEFEFEYKDDDFIHQYKLLKEYQNDSSKLLWHVSKHGYLDLVKHIVKKGVSSDELSNVLISASLNGKLEIVKWLVENGADVNFKGNLAMTWASDNGHWEVVKYLIERGANVHENREHVLKNASRTGTLDIVRYLVEHGANVKADELVLLNAYWGKNEEIKQYLIQQGATLKRN